MYRFLISNVYILLDSVHICAPLLTRSKCICNIRQEAKSQNSNHLFMAMLQDLVLEIDASIKCIKLCIFSFEFSKQLIFRNRFYLSTNIQRDFSVTLLHGKQIKSSNNIELRHPGIDVMFRVNNNIIRFELSSNFLVHQVLLDGQQ